MAIIKGQNLRVFIDGECIGFATSCSLHVSAQLEDISTKDSTGDWSVQEVVGKSWDLSADALFSADDFQAVNGWQALETMISGQPVEIEFTQTEGEKNQQKVGNVTYYGDAIINDITINAANRQNASYSIQMQGVGPLAEKTE